MQVAEFYNASKYDDASEVWSTAEKMGYVTRW